jgi:hypothetical protein
LASSFISGFHASVEVRQIGPLLIITFIKGGSSILFNIAAMIKKQGFEHVIIANSSIQPPFYSVQSKTLLSDVNVKNGTALNLEAISPFGFSAIENFSAASMEV